MDLPKFSVRDDINAQHYVTVKLNKFGDKKTNTYNGKETITYWGNCHVDGVEHMWFISENMKKGITEGGFGEGDTFCVKKWKEGDKMGYNYLDKEDIQITNAKPMKVMEQTAPTFNDESIIEKHHPGEDPGDLYIGKEIPNAKFEPPKDDIQERIIKGMCGNQASNMMNISHELSDNENAIEHFRLTKAIYELEQDWYRN